MEPNPFERSFASKDASGELKSPSDSDGKKTNKHNLHIPNISNLNGTPNKLPGITPPIFTPGGRRLPPLGLSPPGHLSNPGTPGSNLWNSLLTATNNHTEPAPFVPPTGGAQNGHYPQYTGRKTGLTPNELNLRSGLTPGGSGFPFHQVPGLTTPSALLNSPMTPGLSSLLGINGQQQQIPTQEGFVPKSGPIKETEKEPVVKTEIKEIENRPDKEKRTRQASSQPAKKQKVEEKKTKGKKDKKDPEDDKRKSFLERNRVAASKCRQRKKQLIQKMEDELAFYSSGYRELSAQVQQLREQLLNVRGVLVGHKECSGLAQSMGGYDQLNNFIRQTEYVAEMAQRNGANALSIPSTIPTTLTEAPAPAPVPPATTSEQPTYNAPPPAPTTTTIAPQLPIQETQSFPPPAPISSHHSLTDLPAAANQEEGSLRTIHSMSNLAGQQLPENRYENYNLRTVNSMMNLQQRQPVANQTFR